MSPRLTLIAAVSADGYISHGKGVPWDLPADRAQFREKTRGRWLLLGRRTYDEMNGWFRPGHVPLVLSRDASLSVPGGRVVQSVHDALRMAGQAGEHDLMCCGGAEVYAAAMPQAHSLVITHVRQKLGGGLSFPAISSRDWEPVLRQPHDVDHEHACAFEVVTYQRVMHRGLDLAA
jgi:dihydrofolate reductase